MKKFLGVIVVLMALLAGGGYLAVRNIDGLARRYKSTLERWVSDAIGGELRAKEVRVQLLPSPRVELGAAALTFPGGAHAVEAEMLSLEFEIIPLIWRSIQIKAVTLEGAVVQLERGPDGVSFRGRAKDESAAPERPRTAGAPSGGGGFFVRFERIEVRNSRIDIRDSATDAHTTIEGFSASGALRYEAGDVRISPLTLRAERALGWGEISGELRELRYNQKNGEAVFTAPHASFGGLSGAFEGNFNTETGVGRVVVRGAPSPIRALLEAASPLIGPDIRAAAAAAKVEGTVEPALTVEILSAGRFRVNGTAAAANGAAVHRGAALREINGIVRVAVNESGGKIAFENAAGVLGAARSRVSGEGDFELAPLRGEVRLAAPTLSLGDLTPILAEFGVRDLPLTGGRGAVKVGCRLNDDGGFEWSVTGEISEGAGAFEGVPFQDGVGKIRLSGGAGGDLRLLAENVSLGVNSGKEVVTLNADLRGSDLHGSLSLVSPNLRIKTVAPLLGDLSTLGPDLDGEVRLDLRGKRSSDPLRLRGTIGVSGGRFDLGALPVSELQGEIVLHDDSNIHLSTAGLEFVLNGEPVTLSGDLLGDGVEWRFRRGAIAGCGGRFSGEVGVSNETPRRFSITGSGSGILAERCQPLLVGGEGEGALAGELSDLRLRLTGEIGEGFDSALSGAASFRLENGALRGVNLGRTALEKIGSIPVLGGALISGIPPEYRPSFNAPDTPLRLLSAEVVFDGGRAETNGVRVVSDLFALDGRGSYRLGGDVDLVSTLYFEPGFARALAARVRELRGLFGPDGTLSVPLTLRGDPLQLEVRPDVRGLLQMGMERAIEQGASEFIDRALDRLGGGAPSGGDRYGGR